MMQNNPNVNDTQTNKKSFDKFSVIFFTLSFLLVFWFFVYFIASIEGVDFPKEHELHHTEGIFKPYQIGVNIGRNTYKGVLIQLAKTTNSKPQEAIYICDYSVVGDRAGRGCLKSNDELRSNLNKPAKIGWYIPKPFLWFNDPNPRMVTLDIDGKSVISYQEAQTKIMQRNKESKIFNLIFILTISPALIFMYVQLFRNRID